MATGVKPRDEETSLSRADLDAIQDAMKNKKFRDLLSEYCDEVRDPANQAVYQKEMTQLEKERGYDVTFINPKGGYVIKTSVAGDRKAFINICSNTNVDKPSCSVQKLNGQKGVNWQLPYTIIPPREDYDKNKQRCVVYDVVFHPDTLRMAEVNKRFRELVNKTAFEGLQNTFNIHFDNNNCRFPRLNYKGMSTPAVIRKEDPNFVPPDADEDDAMSPELLEKLYPQKVYSENIKSSELSSEPKYHRKKTKNNKEYSHSSEKGYTIPKYVIKQQKNVDLQDYTYEKNSKQYIAIPTHIIVIVNLPLLTSTKDCVLDVKDRSLSLISEKPAKYKLNITLPYSVNDECGNAKFDKTKNVLTVTLPVRAQNIPIVARKPLRADSGIDSESNSFDEEEETKKCLVQEIKSPICSEPNTTATENTKEINSNEFLESTVSYILPSYTYNVLDDVIAFTFHVKNTDPSSVQVKREGSKIYIKFFTIGSGFMQMYYAATILFEDDVTFNDATGEAWDNNVILQLELSGCMPKCFSIGLHDEMTKEFVESSQTSKASQETEKVEEKEKSTEDAPTVEVTNTGNKTNILVSSKSHVEEEHKERQIVWVDSGHSENGAKSILRKPISIMRSYSESSTGDVASSMDYISSDCIPEESSLKKTVRFSDVIAKQFYRFNSSIEGQKRKNQRKKSKKRNQDRRRSESEAEEDTLVSIQSSQPRKSALKKRHDSGMAESSDAEGDCKYTMSDSEVAYEKIKYSENTSLRKGSSELALDDSEESKVWAKKLSKETSKKAKLPSKVKEKPCDIIKHNTNLYDPDRLNKGLYTEVKFKNDLIFDLDM